MSLKKILKRRNKISKRKEEHQKYLEARDVGDCFMKKDGCSNNGDMTTHCRFCDFKVQACTFHAGMGRDEAKKHLLTEHPVRTLPALTIGVLRGQSLE